MSWTEHTQFSEGISIVFPFHAISEIKGDTCMSPKNHLHAANKFILI